MGKEGEGRGISACPFYSHYFAAFYLYTHPFLLGRGGKGGRGRGRGRISGIIPSDFLRFTYSYIHWKEGGGGGKRGGGREERKVEGVDLLRADSAL